MNDNRTERDFRPQAADDLAGLMLPQEPDLDKLIEKQINRRIRTIVLKSLVTVAILTALVLLGIDPLVRAQYTDPVKLNSDAVMAKDEQVERDSTLFRVIDAWLELQFPLRELDWIEAKSLRFGKYQLSAHVLDLSRSIVIGAPSNVEFTMTRGELAESSDPSSVLMAVTGDFVSKEKDSTLRPDMAEIQKLPESAWLEVAVSEKTPVALTSLREEISDAAAADDSGLSLDWARIETPAAEIQGGINLYHVRGTMERHPDEMNEQQLKDWYLENIKLLADHPEVWQNLGFRVETEDGMTVYNTEEPLKDLYQKVKASDSLLTGHYIIRGSRDEILSFLKTRDLLGAAITAARLTGSVSAGY